MNAFTTIAIPIPKDWQDFERKSRVLFECVLKDPLIQTHGRGGQKQDGVDIFGQRAGRRKSLVGVQCKGKDGQYGKPITDKELRREVERSQKFEPSLDEFILITTAPDDVRIQKNARLLERELWKAGRRLRIAVWGWNTLEQRISEHELAIKIFHPDATPFSDRLFKDHDRQLAKLDQIIKQLEEIELVKTNRRPVNVQIDELGPLLDIIIPVNKLRLITSEKGKTFNRHGTWPRDSLFHFIDSSMRPESTNSSLERFPHLICDDGAGECADFIGWDESKPRIAFVHAKAEFASPHLSVQALQAACARLTPNLILLKNGPGSMPRWGQSWSQPWRLRAGARTAEQAKEKLIELLRTPRVGREIWIVLGGILSKKVLRREIRRGFVSSRALQVLHVILASTKTCHEAGANLRIYCSP